MLQTGNWQLHHCCSLLLSGGYEEGDGPAYRDPHICTTAIRGKVQDRIVCRRTASFKHNLTEGGLDLSKMLAASRQFCHCYHNDMKYEARERENPRHHHDTVMGTQTSDHK
jgi:hypothetical protein